MVTITKMVDGEPREVKIVSAPGYYRLGDIINHSHEEPCPSVERIRKAEYGYFGHTKFTNPHYCSMCEDEDPEPTEVVKKLYDEAWEHRQRLLDRIKDMPADRQRKFVLYYFRLVGQLASRESIERFTQTLIEWGKEVAEHMAERERENK